MYECSSTEVLFIPVTFCTGAVVVGLGRVSSTVATCIESLSDGTGL